MALTQSELEARLLAAANSLRGPVDPADFKQYVFPLLFLKRISDFWDTEHEAALAEYGDDVPSEVLADFHRFTLPDGCHWRDLRGVNQNVGVKLRRILHRIEEANAERLGGIFGEVGWANKERLPEHALLNLLAIFDSIPLDPRAVPHDMLGNAYEYLLREFAEASGKKAGEFFTPRAVVRLLTRLLAPRAGESIYDPACGSGGMLVEAVNEVREKGGNHLELRLFGQEVNLTTAAIARMNLYLHDIEDAKVRRGDTLRDPKFLTDRGALSVFDVVIANPPFSLKNWGADVWADDDYKRGFCGVPPGGNGDWAWIQHMIASMKQKTGRVGVVMPHGVLFRVGQEAAIRQCIAQSERLEAVIELPPNLFYSTTIPGCLLIFRDKKPRDRDGNLLFIDASRAFARGRNQNQMTDAHVDEVVAAYRAGTADGGGVTARLVGMAEVKENDWNLSVGRYLSNASASVNDVPAALARLHAAQKELRGAETSLKAQLRRAGYA